MRISRTTKGITGWFFGIALLLFACRDDDKTTVIVNETYQVVSLFDGDSFTARTSGGNLEEFRLYGIDAPEKDQPFGDSARIILEKLLAVPFTVSVKDIDQFDRKIIIAEVDSISVNESLLAQGAAWHYVFYDQNPVWSKLEADARAKKIGLWKNDNPIAPWDWRE